MINACRVCRSPLSNEPFYRLSGMPRGAQYYPREDELKSDFGIELNIHVCPSCSLHQLDADPVPYYRDVIRSAGYSATMIDIRKKQYAFMIDKFSLQGKKVFECGCGQGEFLEAWNQFPVLPFGVEHSQQLVDAAVIKGLNVRQGFLGNTCCDPLLEGTFDAFTCFNFLEHQPDPKGMLDEISRHLTLNGVGLITVPSVEYILEHNAYYEFVIDHLLYFSRNSLMQLLQMCGFSPVAFDDVQEDTHCVYVKKTPPTSAAALRECQTGINSALQTFIHENTCTNGQIAVWGASHQSFTILSSAHITESISFIIDSAPFKQGRFSPTSHIPIVSPDNLLKRKPAAIIIIAPNYSDEILATIRNDFNLSCPVAIVRNGTVDYSVISA